MPQGWKNISFEKLRTEGAFIVSAKKENGQIKTVSISAEKDGVLLLKNPFNGSDKYMSILQSAVQKNSTEEGMLRFDCKKGAKITLRVK